MDLGWFFGRPRPVRWTLVEDPDQLGYRLVADPLLEIMDAGEWWALERRAIAQAD